MTSSLRAFFGVFSGFIPLIILWSSSDPRGILLALLVAALFLALKIRKKNTGIMSPLLVLFLAVSAILYFRGGSEFVFIYRHPLSFALLSLTGFISAALGKPYTMYDAQAGYGEKFADSPLFIEVNILITRIWASIYLLSLLSRLLGGSSLGAVILSNSLIALGIFLSITIPLLLPEAEE